MADARESAGLGRAFATLASASGVGTAVGVLQGIYVAAALGPATLGVLGAAQSLNAMMTNLVDVRLGDVIARRYYQVVEEERGAVDGRPGLLVAGALVQLVLSALTLAGALLLNALVLRRLVDTPYLFRSVALVAAGDVLGGVAGYGSYLVRLGGSTRTLAREPQTRALARAVVVVSAVALAPSLQGYAIGHVLGNAVGVVIAAGFALATHPRSIGGAAAVRRGLASLWQGRSLIAWTNVLGYVKMLHRGADVTLVAVFCSDRDTGVYKLARQMLDAAGGVTELADKLFGPRLLEATSRRDWTTTASLIGSLRRLGFTLFVTLGVGALGVLTPLVGWVLPQYRSSVMLVAILLPTVAVSVSWHVWVWNGSLALGRVGRFVLIAAAAAVAGQYGIPLGLRALTGEWRPAWFAIGFTSVGLIQFALAARAVRRDLEQWCAG